MKTLKYFLKVAKKYILIGIVIAAVINITIFYNNYLNKDIKKVEISPEVDKYAITETLTRDNFYDLVATENIDNVIKESPTNLIIKTKDNKYYNLDYSSEYINKLALIGVIDNIDNFKNVEVQKSTFLDVLFTLFMWFLIIFCFVKVIKYFRNRGFEHEIHYMQGIGAERGSSEVKSEDDGGKIKEDDGGKIKKVTFDEVQGIDELKPDLYRLVDCLKNPDKYTKLGARLPKGVIFYGPPGTGKTLTAKALAGEASVPFFSASGSDFIEKYVGVGASRIRELYKKARRNAPCIVFIDEIDAIGGGRGESSNGEKDQTINALLTELDGFKSMEGVLTICATNRLDILDPALMRAGRFDLKLAIELPDKKGRLQILTLHSSNKKLSKGIDLEELAKKTHGLSGAELENLLNESALIAATENKSSIDNEDIENAFFKILMEGNKKKRDENDNSGKLVAYHEAGHTLATKLLTKNGVPTVTIIQSTSGAGGVTFITQDEVGLQSKLDLKNRIKVDFAGRVAEEILLGNDDNITTGASQDIKEATAIIKAYISNYGMGTKGMIDIKQLTSNYDIVDEASELADTLYKETLDLLTKNRDKLDRLALTLLDKETLYETEIDELIKG